MRHPQLHIQSYKQGRGSDRKLAFLLVVSILKISVNINEENGDFTHNMAV